MSTTETASDHDQLPDQPAPGFAQVDVLWVDPRELVIHDNVRTDVALDKEFVADIAERGVRQVIPVRRDASGRLVVRTGQRRVLAAIEAGLDRVRVLVEDEELTDERDRAIDRILDQLGENEHRCGLGEADEVRATQQLLGLGLSARQIARRRHLPTKRVQTAVTVARNQLALDALAQGQLDLTQAAVLAEFADDQDAVLTLTSAASARPEQFEHIAQQLRDDREETRLRAELTAALTARGVTIIERPDTLFGGQVRALSELAATVETEPGTTLTAERHASCPGHAAFIDDRVSWRPVAERVTAVWVCTDFLGNGHAERYTAVGATTNGKVPGAMTEERKAQRREVIANNKAWDSATTVRRDWLRTFFARQAAPKDAPRWIAVILARGGHDARRAMESAHPVAVELLGIKGGSRGYGRARTHVIETAAAQASPGRATLLTVVMLLSALENGTDRHTWRSPTDEQLAYFQRLRTWGYPLSDVEMLVLNAQAPDRTEPDPQGDESGPDKPGGGAGIAEADDTDQDTAA